MADHTEKLAKFLELSASTETDVQFERPGRVRVVNLSTTATVWVRIDGTAATVEGDDCYVVAPASELVLDPVTFGAPEPALVSLISEAAVEVWVGVLPRYRPV